MANDLLVRILGDNKQLLRTFQQSNAATVSFGRNMQQTGAKLDGTTKALKGFAAGTAAGFAGSVVFAEVTQQIRAAIDVASNLREQMSKTNVVFGDSADEVEAWSKTTAESIGIARDEALAAASTFGAMFDQAGAASADAANLSKQVVQLAADLASFSNTGVEESLNALRSGLSGEIEPLRRFQVFLTEAAVAQEAMAKSGKTNARELTQGEKIMARWNLILQQTSKQQGDFARTSSGLAQQQKVLAAQVRGLQANLGDLLLPAMTTLVTALNDATRGALALGDALSAIANVNIPVIEIPLKVVFTGDLPGRAGSVGGEFAKNLLPPQFRAALPFIKALQEAAKSATVPDTRAAAEAFTRDTGIGAFIQNLPKEIQKKVKDAAAKSFGEKGFKPVENELGETLAARFADSLDSLSLRFDQAVVTKGTADELAVLASMERAINARIATQGRTTDLLRLLFEVDERRRNVIEGAAAAAKAARQESLDRLRELAADRREMAEKARQALREAMQAGQFRALGLSETGDEIIPGIKNLQARISGALKRIASGDIDVGSKLADRLKLAQTLIRRQGGKLTEETRRTINELIRTVTQGQKKLEDVTKTGPLTKTTALNTDKMLQGLGLDRATTDELAARLRRFNTGGVALAASRGQVGAFGRPITGQGGVTITGPITVMTDNPDDFIRQLEKKGNRSPGSRSGRFAGRRGGI